MQFYQGGLTADHVQIGNVVKNSSISLIGISLTMCLQRSGLRSSITSVSEQGLDRALDFAHENMRHTHFRPHRLAIWTRQGV